MKPGACIFTSVSKSLFSYVARIYVGFYAGLLVTPCIVAARLLFDTKVAFVSLLPLSFIATVALCAAVLYLAGKNEIEALQSFGVRARNLALPLALLSFGPQLLVSALTIAVAGDTAYSMLYALLSLMGLLVAFSIGLTFVWQLRDAYALRSCIIGLCAQLGITASAIALGSLAPFWLVVALAGVATTAVIAYLIKKHPVTDF